MSEEKPKPHLTTCISIADAAEFLGVSELTVRRLIDAKKLKATHINRRVVITPQNMEAYLAASEKVVQP
jgi:excisionase family DNA binding protein